jgi:putative salt-induced outer membrane protein YdiY
MKNFLPMLLIFFSYNCVAGFYGEIDYSVLHYTDSQFTTGSGETNYTNANIDARYLGLGVRYVFTDVLLDDLNIEPLFKVFIPAKDRDINELTLLELGASVSYSIGQHQPFLSLMMISASDPDPSLDYSLGLGYQLGYRYNLTDRHMLYFTHSWKTLESENPQGGVFDQETVLSVFTLGYGYRFF